MVWLTSVETENLFKKWGASTIFLPFAANPNFFKPIIGIRRSIINIDTATKNVIIRNCISNGIILEKWITNNPTQLVIGPGIIGLKLPIIPKMQKIKPTIIKNISIKIKTK